MKYTFNATMDFFIMKVFVIKLINIEAEFHEIFLPWGMTIVRIPVGLKFAKSALFELLVLSQSGKMYSPHICWYSHYF